MNSKKILIIHASAGSGHLRAAQALYNYIKGIGKDEVEIIDALNYTNPIFKYLYLKGYQLLVTYFPFLWAFAYNFTFKRRFIPLVKRLRFITNRLNAKKLERFLLEYQPDTVVATHFLPIEVISYLKNKQTISSKLNVVITDFNIHPLWTSPHVNKYFLACEHTKQELIDFGISEDKIVVSGIPVDLKFSKNYDKRLNRKQLGINPDKFTVTLTTSGFGFGGLEHIVNELCKEVQLIVVCGKNLKLFNKLEKRDHINTKIFKFVNNFEELLAASDIIITKPGGLTITESLVMNLPMIFIATIAGQEARNVAVLEKYGIAQSASNIDDIKHLVNICLKDTCYLGQIKERISKIKKPNATKEIYLTL